MATTNFQSVDDYIASQPDAIHATLERVRNAIRRALPNADETISYQIPTYKLKGRAVIYFAGWKQHYSLYPATAQILATFKKELAPYKVNKGTIRFSLSEPVPTKLIQGIAKLRAKEVDESEKVRAAIRSRRGSL
jgi:uncharacterized protein YdhG (YjbR/CyaY superfamily)